MNIFSNLKKIKAFTLFEAVVCFTIMGTVFVSTLTQIKVNDKYDKLYWVAFDTLLQASKNASNAYQPTCSCEEDTGAVSGCSSSSDCVCWSDQCWKLEWGSDPRNPGKPFRMETLHKGGTDHTRIWPGFLYGQEGIGDYDGTGTDYTFCKTLTSKINTLLPIGECRSFISGINKKSFKWQGVNFYEAFCTSSDKEQPCIGHEIEPTFVAANGQRFYISSTVTANAVHSLFGATTPRSTYRFVVVDLNGSAGPNTQFKTALRYPDIVLFAINSTGDVIPLGLPEFYMNYIKATVQYDEYLDEVDPNDPTKYKKNDVLVSSPMTLDAAKKHAWGMPYGSSMPNLYGQLYQDNEPLSHSILFYNNALNCSSEGSCISSNKNERYVDDLFAQIVMQFLYKEEGSNEYFSQLSEPKEVGVATSRGCSSEDSPCKIVFSQK